ncbi:hypothetical protein YQE_09765, partial [Dendroctonus ponderosae]
MHFFDSKLGEKTASYDMSPFIRRYARYLNEKALSYRSVAFDFCKVKRGKEDGVMRTMNPDKLLKTIPVLQSQLGALLDFDCTANDLSNGIINMCFMLLFRDLIRLFACYNDAIINLLEKYFDMNKKQCKEALDIYKKFLVRMDSVSEFLKVAENVGIDKGDIPDLTKAPNSLLDALEQHYNHMEGKKASASSSATSSSSSATVSNQSTPAVDLFTTEAPAASIKASDDLLQLSNPFVDPFNQPAPASNNFSMQQQLTSAWVVNGNGYDVQPTRTNPIVSNGGFVSENSFASVFGNTGASGNFDALGGVLQPINNNGQITNGTPLTNSTPADGSQQAPNGGLLTGDLESSLASLAENLTINDRKQTIKGVQWNSSKNSSKPSWTPQPMSATTGAGYKPMNQQLNNAPFGTLFTPAAPTATPIVAPMLSQPIFPQLPQMGMKSIAPMITPLSPMGSMSTISQQPNSMGAQQQQLLFH